MRPAWWIALLTAVWSVYTADHLLDARKTSGPLTTHRHAFHRAHARALSVALGVAVALGFAASLWLPLPVRVFGLAIAVLVMVYLASAQGRLLPQAPKEPMAGFVYAAGIWGGPLIVSGAAPWPVAAASLHALAAILNLIATGVFEAEVDRSLRNRSLCLRYGERLTTRNALASSALGAMAAISGGFMGPPGAMLAFGVLAIQISMPAVMLVGSTWFGRHERYRVWGDSVFLIGALPRLTT